VCVCVFTCSCKKRQISTILQVGKSISSKLAKEILKKAKERNTL
jgi:hypothetical protein